MQCKDLSPLHPDFWDLLIKALGWLVTAGAAWFGVVKYHRQRRREAIEDRKQKERELAQRAQELRVKVFEKELELYSRASEAVSKIALAARPGAQPKSPPADEPSKKTMSPEDEFWTLYWGPLCIVESPAVEKAMMALGSVRLSVCELQDFARKMMRVRGF